MTIPRVTPGTKITPATITARGHNMMADAAEAYAAGGLTPDRGADTQIIRIRNSGAETIQRFDAVELLDPIFKPGQGTEGFNRLAAFDAAFAQPGSTPSKVAIAQDPIVPGAMGRATLFGMSPVRDIVIVDESHTRATAAPGGILRSSSSGPFVIVWVDDPPENEDPRAAIVSISPDDRQLEYWIEINGAQQAGDNRWSYRYLVVGWVDGAWTRPTPDITHEDLGLAYNTMEANNSDEAIQGNGINQFNLDGTGFSIVPIGNGAIVKMVGPYQLDGEDIWFFTAPNQADGSCP